MPAWNCRTMRSPRQADKQEVFVADLCKTLKEYFCSSGNCLLSIVIFLPEGIKISLPSLTLKTALIGLCAGSIILNGPALSGTNNVASF